MKNRLYIFALVLLGASFFATSCIQEEFPYGSSATKDQIEDSSFAADGMIAAAPASMITNYIGIGEHYDFGYPGILASLDRAIGEVFPSNAYSGGNQYYDRFQVFMYHIGLGPSNTLASSFLWYNYYQFIKSANDLILVCGENEALAEQRGVAKAFRALFYLDLARLYDPLYAESEEKPRYTVALEDVEGLTVPIVDEHITEEIAQNNPRVPRDEMFRFILSDLNDAKTCLADYAPTAKNVPSLAVVYGLMARTYLWLGGFTETYEGLLTGTAAYKEAAKYARMAIEASGCTPLTEAQWVDPKNGFNKVNNAWMWAMMQSSDTVLNNLLSWAAHQCCEAEYGYGAMTQPAMRRASYERMSDTDFRKRLVYGPEKTYADMKDITNIPESRWTIFSEEKKGARVYAHFKFRTNSGELTNYSIANVVDIPLMRVEEMYFIEAEAMAHYSEAEAREKITSFMTSYRDPRYSIPASGDLVEEIIFQKRCEFWGEGIMFFDFKRLDMGIHNAYDGTNAPAGADFETKGRCPGWNYCIPLAEVQQNVALKGLNNPDPSSTLKAHSSMPESVTNAVPGALRCSVVRK
ncbi:MAG: RagB/SusD family nutrient uptake outer membrane protein [Rikenellaceae bacterium]|nr:RagB/SusD family nutrient uptake outer membrane protein [Rikenellaceae bacterium]